MLSGHIERERDCEAAEDKSWTHFFYISMTFYNVKYKNK